MPRTRPAPEAERAREDHPQHRPLARAERHAEANLAATAVACLLVGVLPAVRLSRRDVSASLKGVPQPSRVRIANQSVLQRTREFGVRMALGATPGRVLRVVLAREDTLIAAALFAGSIGTILVIKTLISELVWINALNPAWPAPLIGLCGVIAGLSCALATHRIVTLDPSAVLQHS